jgi:hypothetical protein
VRERRSGLVRWRKCARSAQRVPRWRESDPANTIYSKCALCFLRDKGGIPPDNGYLQGEYT